MQGNRRTGAQGRSALTYQIVQKILISERICPAGESPKRLIYNGMARPESGINVKGL
jgi:hypothetical protein